jgi:small subunit ribosomal protein S1
MQQAAVEDVPAPVSTSPTEGDKQPAAEEPGAEPAKKPGMTEVFSEDYTYVQPKRGEIRQAQVITISDDGVMVDLGLKREGLIPAYDLQRVGGEVADSLSLGDEIPVYIVRPEDKEGNIVVSWYRARQEQDWLDAQELHENGGIWEGDVRGYNRGGLIVPFGKIRGFVPASHVTGISRRMNHASVQARLAEMVGQTLPLKVLEVNRQSRRLIFSERIARRQWRAKKREQLLEELQEGDHVHGTVSNICDFGAFVDIGGTDGLVHISELSWRRTNHPSEVLNVGDEVDAYVLRVDRQRKRIGLSLRLLQPDPWETADENYHVGQLVTGVVTKLTDFGAFAALEDGIEGLIHISELAEVPPRHPSEVIARGAELPLLVVKVDSRRQRMGLSLKRVSEEEWYQWEEARRAQAVSEQEELEVEAEAAETADILEAAAEGPPDEEAAAAVVTEAAEPEAEPEAEAPPEEEVAAAVVTEAAEPEAEPEAEAPPEEEAAVAIVTEAAEPEAEPEAEAPPEEEAAVAVVTEVAEPEAEPEAEAPPEEEAAVAVVTEAAEPEAEPEVEELPLEEGAAAIVAEAEAGPEAEELPEEEGAVAVVEEEEPTAQVTEILPEVEAQAETTGPEEETESEQLGMGEEAVAIGVAEESGEAASVEEPEVEESGALGETASTSSDESRPQDNPPGE